MEANRVEIVRPEFEIESRCLPRGKGSEHPREGVIHVGHAHGGASVGSWRRVCSRVRGEPRRERPHGRAMGEGDVCPTIARRESKAAWNSRGVDGPARRNGARRRPWAKGFHAGTGAGNGKRFGRGQRMPVAVRTGFGRERARPFGRVRVAGANIDSGKERAG